MENLEDFFKNEEALMLVDMMAKRYGKLPTEIINDLTVYEFNLNSAIMLSALTIEAGQRKDAQENVSDGKTGKQFQSLKDFGVKVKTTQVAGAK